MDYENGWNSSENKDYKLPPEELDTEFKKEFPPDLMIGSEMDDAARVWKVYRKEAMAFDNALLEGWSSTLDILLIFAGLFSAVATAFVVESYKLLLPDNSAYAATALYILVTASNHSTGLTLQPPPDLGYGSPVSRLINGLWFTSIVLALAVALLSILVKQWITQYRARNIASARSPHDWARRHQVYSQALTAWPVAEVVSLLPVLLHMSLFLFCAGVVAFLWTLDRAIAIWIMVLSISLAIFYLGCTLVPLWIPECPTSTPMVHSLRKVAIALALLLLRSFLHALSVGQRLKEGLMIVGSRLRSRGSTRNKPTASDDDPVLPVASQPPTRTVPMLSISERLDRSLTRAMALRSEEAAIAQRLVEMRDTLDASALHWLITDVPDSDAVAVGLQALGAIQPLEPLAQLLRLHDHIAEFSEATAFTRTAAERGPAEVLRVARSALCMARKADSVVLVRRVSSLRTLRYLDHPDVAVYCLSLKDVISRAMSCDNDASPSLTSTAIHALRSEQVVLLWRLAYLLCCDLEQLSDADWDLVLESITADAQVARLHGHIVLTGSSNSRQLRLADMMAHLVFDHRDNRLRSMAARLIPRLMCALPRDKDHPHTEPVRHQPYLLEFFTSNLFLEQEPDVKSLVAVAGWLCSGVHDAMDNVEMLPKFWQALSQVVYAGSNEAHFAALQNDVLTSLATALRACVRPGSRGSTTLLSTTLRSILLPIPHVASQVSIWTMIEGTRNSGLLPIRLVVEEALTAALSLYARTGESTGPARACVDAFFAELDHTKTWRLLVAVAWNYESQMIGISHLTGRAIHFLQHCVELRPQWWLDALSNATRLGRPEVEAMARELDVRISSRGPCTDCPTG